MMRVVVGRINARNGDRQPPDAEMAHETFVPVDDVLRRAHAITDWLRALIQAPGILDEILGDECRPKDDDADS